MSDQSATPTIYGVSCVVDPPSTAASDTSNAANVAKARRVDTDVDTAEPGAMALDLPRAIALATALDAFVRTGMSDHARPISAELVALLRASERAGGDVVPIGAARAKRDANSV